MINVKAPCQQSISQSKEKEKTTEIMFNLCSMSRPLLGDSFKPRLSLDCTTGTILLFILKVPF